MLFNNDNKKLLNVLFNSFFWFDSKSFLFLLSVIIQSPMMVARKVHEVADPVLPNQLSVFSLVVEWFAESTVSSIWHIYRHLLCKSPFISTWSKVVSFYPPSMDKGTHLRVSSDSSLSNLWLFIRLYGQTFQPQYRFYTYIDGIRCLDVIRFFCENQFLDLSKIRIFLCIFTCFLRTMFVPRSYHVRDFFGIVRH